MVTFVAQVKTPKTIAAIYTFFAKSKVSAVFHIRTIKTLEKVFGLINLVAKFGFVNGIRIH